MCLWLYVYVHVDTVIFVLLLLYYLSFISSVHNFCMHLSNWINLRIIFSLFLVPFNSLLALQHSLLFNHYSSQLDIFRFSFYFNFYTSVFKSVTAGGKDAGSDSSINTIDTKLNRRESHMTVKRRNSTAPNVLFNFTCDSETSLVFERDPDVRYSSTFSPFSSCPYSSLSIHLFMFTFLFLYLRLDFHLFSPSNFSLSHLTLNIDYPILFWFA